jgi:DNA-binding response OmpR family regulator
MSVTCCPSCGADLEALSAFELGSLKIDYSGAIILWKGERVQLSPADRLMLLAIVRAGGHPVQRWVLAETIGYEGDAADNNAAVHLCRINNAFREIDPAFAMIENVRCRGLRWKVENA